MLQSLPLLSDQRPSELMDKMLVLLPEDEKPGFFFRGLFMDRLSSDIRAHLLSESINDLRRMALRADELWTILLVFLCRFSLRSLRTCMPCHRGIRPLDLGPAVLFLGLPVVPQFQKTIGEPVLRGFAGTTANGEIKLVSVELPVPIRETSQRQDYFNAIPADSPSSNLIFLQNVLPLTSFWLTLEPLFQSIHIFLSNLDLLVWGFS